jgi:hypothetical protein
MIAHTQALARLAGTLDLVLVFVFARRLFRDTTLGVLAALFLMCDPAHFSYSRLASDDGVWAVPFVLGWLIALEAYVETPSRPAIVGAALALGAGVYTQPSAPLLMLLLAIASAVVLRARGILNRADAAAAAATFALVLMPLAVWFAWHPSAYVDTWGRWVLHPAHIRNPVEWARSVTNWLSLSVWSSVFWDFFSPSHLIASATAPAFAGVFLVPVCAFMAVGATALARQTADEFQPQRPVLTMLTVTVIAAAAIAASFKEPRAIQRALVVAPVGCVVAAYGASALWSRRRTWPRVMVALLLVGAIVQFAVFFSTQVSPTR